MGLNIGQSALELGRVSRSDVGELARQAASAAAREARPGVRAQEGSVRPGLNPSASGIDQRAVNGPAAALRTIDSGVASARQIVPDVQDILAIARERFTELEAAREARLEEQRAEQSDEETSDSTPPEERVLPEASRQARAFEANNTPNERRSEEVQPGNSPEVARQPQPEPRTRLNIFA
ncbi:MAG: hypothetical protein RLZZ303_2182 [Candidatus Hydrogenedentota bacterium]|jgi:hypothetical protein